MLQVVCNERLEFLHVYCAFPGSVHDSRVFRHSGIQDILNEGNLGEYHVLADSAYTLQEHVMTPFRNNGFLTAEQRFFNRTHSSVRCMVECSIALLKGRWRWLLDRLSMRRMDLAPYYIIACCILHNLCLKRDADLIIPQEIPAAPEYLGPLEPERQRRLAGIVRRYRITDMVNDWRH